MTQPLMADHQWSSTRRRWLSADALPSWGGRDRIDRISGTLLPGLRDHHVHLGLVSAAALAASALDAVDDLGWIPDLALRWQRDGVAGRAVRVAGPFLTAPGGYPVGRTWAPSTSVIELPSAAAGVAVVADLTAAGVAMIKIALNASMPLLDDATLQAVIAAAHERSLTVVVHAEGEGQPARALAAGADVLAHTPWTERLPDRLVRGLASGLSWISTLTIHGTDEHAGAVALDNLARFHRAGGRIHYGTDMGNGPTPVDVSRAEIEALVSAGLDQATILASICCSAGPTDHVSWSPYDPPTRVEGLAEWLTTVRRRPVDDWAGAA